MPVTLTEADKPIESSAIDAAHANDANQGVRRHFMSIAEVREATVEASGEPAARSPLTVVVNTSDVDRYRSILDPKGCQYEAYLQNPVLLWQHGMDYAGSWPIGRSLRVRPSQDAIEVDIEFDTEGAMGAELDRLYRQRWLRGFSVGFIPVDAVFEMVNGSEVIRFTKWELVEISCVAVPANPYALARAIGAKEISDSRLIESIEQVLQRDAIFAPPSIQVRATPAPQPEASATTTLDVGVRLAEAMSQAIENATKLSEITRLGLGGTSHVRAGAEFSTKNRARIRSVAEQLDGLASDLKAASKSLASISGDLVEMVEKAVEAEPDTKSVSGQPEAPGDAQQSTEGDGGLETWQRGAQPAIVEVDTGFLRPLVAESVKNAIAAMAKPK